MHEMCENIKFNWSQLFIKVIFFFFSHSTHLAPWKQNSCHLEYCTWHKILCAFDHSDLILFFVSLWLHVEARTNKKRTGTWLTDEMCIYCHFFLSLSSFIYLATLQLWLCVFNKWEWQIYCEREREKFEYSLMSKMNRVRMTLIWQIFHSYDTCHYLLWFNLYISFELIW